MLTSERLLGGGLRICEVVGVVEGDDLVGEIDLARSVVWSQTRFTDRVTFAERDIPALRACLSFLACKMSASNFLFLSSSSWSLLSPISLIRCRKSLTSSDPSDMIAASASIVVYFELCTVQYGITSPDSHRKG